MYFKSSLLNWTHSNHQFKLQYKAFGEVNFLIMNFLIVLQIKELHEVLKGNFLLVSKYKAINDHQNLADAKKYGRKYFLTNVECL